MGMIYHKIQTVFLRDPETKFKTLLEGEFAKHEFEYLSVNDWTYTEKVDGTNIRVYLGDMEPEFKGKTDRANLHPLLVEALQGMFPGPADPMVLYGEGYGPKIQSGGKYRETQSFVLFDVFCGGLWLERTNVEDIASQLSIPVVPVIGKGSLFDMVDLVRGGFKSQWGNFMAEGSVARPVIELMNRRGERVITKLKHRDFR